MYFEATKGYSRLKVDMSQFATFIKGPRRSLRLFEVVRGRSRLFDVIEGNSRFNVDL